MGGALRGALALATKLGGVKGGVKAAHMGRKAGDALRTMGGRLGPIGFGSNAARTNTAMMFGPDLAFGAMAGAMTPGDLGDKVIAGSMTGLGGALGGVGLRSMYPGSNAAVMMGLELGGGLAGDMAGQGISDSILRVKGGGSTPYEKMAADQQRELEQQILRRVLAGKGGYPGQDQFLAENGLG